MRFALSPLQWLATADGWIDFTGGPPLAELCADLENLGFAAISSGLSPDVDVPAYRDLLAVHAMSPAPGYISCPLDKPAAREEFLPRIERLARAHAELGLGELYVGAGMEPDSPRVLRPAQGVDADAERLTRIAESLERIAETTMRHNVQTCLHPHVGTWIETGEETEWVLDRVDPALLAFGPDTGHLAWAGVDPVDFIRRYRDRVRTMHIKDVRPSVARESQEAGHTYRETVRAGLWAEPGRGELDLHACILAVEHATMWGIIEVDRPDVGTPLDSARECALWAAQAARW